MKLHTIRITNFRSFKKEQSFHFPDEPGLYFMQGVNEAEPRLEANGAGKSTIWEAMLWCFYGKTSRGLKAGDVCNWEAEKGTRVEVDFSLDENTLWTVTRTWKPNAWTLSHISDHITDEEVMDLTKSESNYLLDWLAVEFTPFLHCIMMAQSQPMFLDMKSEHQAALFSEVLGLDHWIDYSARASKKASSQDMESRRLQRDLSEVHGRINGQQDFKGSVEQFETDREFKLSGLLHPYHEKLDTLRRTVVECEDARSAEKKAQDAYDEARAAMERHQKKTTAPAAEAYEKIKYEFRRADDLCEDAKRKFKAIKEEKDCPTCKRPLDRKAHAEHLEEARVLFAEAEARVEEADKRCAEAEQIMAALDKEAVRYLDAFGDASDAMNDASRLVATLKNRRQWIEKELDDMEAQVERIEKEVNPFLDVQERARAEGERLRGERGELQALLDTSEERYQLYSFWVRGFKELRLQLIAEALTELEIEVNSCVTALGLVDWELRFQVDRETKGGSVQRGFSVHVKSPGSDRPTPWEAWSGGESQRLRLAATMGLSNLIRSRMAVDLELEVWDEPSTALSPQGVRDLLESLEHRAQQERRQIWIVDHTAHSFGGFTGGATVIKSEAGSRIEQY